jgi:hypothetical protein
MLSHTGCSGHSYIASKFGGMPSRISWIDDGYRAEMCVSVCVC